WKRCGASLPNLCARRNTTWPRRESRSRIFQGMMLRDKNRKLSRNQIAKEAGPGFPIGTKADGCPTPKLAWDFISPPQFFTHLEMRITRPSHFFCSSFGDISTRD